MIKTNKEKIGAEKALKRLDEISLNLQQDFPQAAQIKQAIENNRAKKFSLVSSFKPTSNPLNASMNFFSESG